MFSTGVERAFQKFAAEKELTRDEALAFIVRDWLMGQSLHSLDDDLDQEEIQASLLTNLNEGAGQDRR
ncbi:hypothetical protein [Shinella zoogloeoides]|uniref:hypothetical protein n=1 Tax=Shinella zoogloeoides TaxID=352475 RepID=UPI000E64ECCD|nr:hypothetical protein [Shinella zoogloeoides]